MINCSIIANSADLFYSSGRFQRLLGYARQLKQLATGLITIGLILLAHTAHAGKPSWAGGNGGGDKGGSLTAPASFNALAVSTNRIDMSWSDPNDGETGFEIERSTSASSGFTLIATTGKNATSYSNTGLASSTTYYYRIRSTGRKGKTSSYVNASATTHTEKTDTQAPELAISPATSRTYTSSQAIKISATANDNVAVSKVEFWNGNTRVKTDTSSPYEHSWMIDATDNVTHNWKAIAFDAANNSSQDAVSLNVDIATADTQAPELAISPATSQTYTSSQAVKISATANDNVGVSKVEFWNGNTRVMTDTSSPYEYSWMIDATDNGTHNWKAIAFDAANNSSQDTVSLNVDIATADTQAPELAISPATSQTYTSSQTVKISATAIDNVGVSKVEFWNGNTRVMTDTSSPYEHNWVIDDTDNGTHNWKAIAFDAANNSSQDAVSLTVDISISSANPGEHLWSLDFGGDTTADDAIGRATAMDSSGDVYVAAMVSGSVNFGGSTLSTNQGGVIAKYTGNGSHLWSKLWSGSTGASLVPTGMVIDDNEGTVIVTGYFSGTVNLGGGSLTSAGSNDLFMVKYTSNGNHLWSRRYGASATEVASDIAIDPYGNLWVAGYVHGSGNLGGSTLSSNSNSRDAFLAKYSPYGDHLLSRIYGGSSVDEATGVAVDSSGNAVITGYFQNSASFGGGAFISAGSYDIFVARYSNSGQHRWSRREGSTSRDQGRSIAVDGSGNIVLGAYFEGAINVGGTSLSSKGSVDGAIVKYSASGTPQWARGIGGSSGDTINGVAVNSSGDIAVTGNYISWMDMGGTYIAGDGSVNVFVARYDANGNHVWSLGTDVAWDDYGYDVAIDAEGGIVATGSYYQGADFGGGMLTNSTLGSTNGFLARFSP